MDTTNNNITNNANTNLRRTRYKQRLNKKRGLNDVSKEFPISTKFDCCQLPFIKRKYNKCLHLLNRISIFENETDSINPSASCDDIVSYFTHTIIEKKAIIRDFIAYSSSALDGTCWVRMSNSSCNCSHAELCLLDLEEKMFKKYYSIVESPQAEFFFDSFKFGFDSSSQETINAAIDALKTVSNTATILSGQFTDGLCAVRDMLLLGAFAVSVVKICGLSADNTMSDKVVLVASAMGLMYFHRNEISEIIGGLLRAVGPADVPRAESCINLIEIKNALYKLIYFYCAKTAWSKATGILDFFEKYLFDVASKFRLTKSLSDIVDNFTEILSFTFNFLSNTILGYDIFVTEDPIKTNIDVFVSCLSKLEEELMTGRKAFNINAYAEFIDLQRMAQRLMYETKDSLNGRTLIEILRTQTFKMAKLNERFMMSNITKNGSRQVPLFVMIMGPTCVGKSWFTALLIGELVSMLPKSVRDFYGSCTANLMTWYYPKSNDHHDGYMGQPIFIIDDYGQRKDSEANPATEIMATIDFVNHEPFTMKMAEASLKGTQFQSLLGFATTNILDWSKEVKSIQCLDALLRRFHFTVLLAIKPDFSCKEGPYDIWNTRLDQSRVVYDPNTLEPEIMTEHYDIYLVDTSSKQGDQRYKVSQPYSFDEFVLMCKQKYKSFEREHISRLRTLNSKTFSDEEEIIPHLKVVDPNLLNITMQDYLHLFGNNSGDVKATTAMNQFKNLNRKISWESPIDGKSLLIVGKEEFRSQYNNYILSRPYLMFLLLSYMDICVHSTIGEDFVDNYTIPLSHLRYLYHCCVNLEMVGMFYKDRIIKFGGDCPKICDNFTGFESRNLEMGLVDVYVRGTNITVNGFSYSLVTILSYDQNEVFEDIEAQVDTQVDFPIEPATLVQETWSEYFKRQAKSFARTSPKIPDEISVSDVRAAIKRMDTKVVSSKHSLFEFHIAMSRLIRNIMSYEVFDSSLLESYGSVLNDYVGELEASYCYWSNLSDILFEGDIYATLTFVILLKPYDYCNAHIKTSQTFLFLFDDCHTDLEYVNKIFSLRATFYERIKNRASFSITEPITKIIELGYVGSMHLIFGTNIQVAVALRSMIMYLSGAFMIYKLGVYAYSRLKVISNTEVIAEGSGTKILAPNYPNDKALSDLKRSVLLHNLCEIGTTDENGYFKRVNYLLFYKGTRFITNAHCVRWLEKNKKLTPDGSVTIKFYNQNNQFLHLGLNKVLNTYIIPDSEIGAGDLEMIGFPLRRDITSKFIPKNHVFPSKFSASWLIQDQGVLRDVSREVRTLNHEYNVNSYLRAMLGDDKRHKYRADDEYFTSPAGVFYRCERIVGDCGFPLFVEDNTLRSSRIFAFHAAGSVTNIDSYATYVNSGHIAECEAFFDKKNSFLSGFAMKVNYPEAECNLDGYIVEGAYPNKAQQVSDSKIRRSQMFESLLPTPFVLSDLKAKTHDVCKRYSVKHKLTFDDKLISLASKSVVKKLSSDYMGNNFKAVRLSFGTAIVAEGFEYLKSLNLGTSSGAPLIWEIPGISGKRSVLGTWSLDGIGNEIMDVRTEIYDYIFINECYDSNILMKVFDISGDLNSPRYWNLSFLRHISKVVVPIKDFISNSHKRVYAPPIYIDYQKDELLKPGKDTRIFSAAPLWYTIAVRMYVGKFMDWCAQNSLHNELAIGLNPYGDAWDRLYKTLSTFRKKIPSDFKAYDTCANPEIMGGFFKELVWGLFSHTYSEEECITTFLLLYGVCFSHHIMDKFCVVMWIMGMPSGNPLTALINCWNQQVLFRMSFIVIAGSKSINLFDSLIKLITLGDDGLRSVSSEIWSNGMPFSEVFSPGAVRDVMTSFGYTITSIEKDLVIEYVEDTDLEFLKRSFVYNPTLNRYVAPLSFKSMLKMLYYTKTNDSVSISETNYKKYMLELSYHGKTVYDMTMTKLRNIAFHREVNFPIPIPWADAVLQNSARQYDVDEDMFI